MKKSEMIAQLEPELESSACSLHTKNRSSPLRLTQESDRNAGAGHR
ncbi:MAG: hypothetical protein WBP97_07915 [Candidatus Sulfotelmatobacter sp.]